jgi:pimeloyl-ACP methyl ester carboxylesterase
VNVDPITVLYVVAVIAGFHILLLSGAVFSLVLPNPMHRFAGSSLASTAGRAAPVDVTLPDGGQAWWFNAADAPERVLLICHGKSRNRRWMLPLIDAVLPHCRVLALEFPNPRRFGLRTQTMGPHEGVTVQHAVGWLNQQGAHDVVVYGVSMGGAASILGLGTAPDLRVSGLVTDGTYDTLQRVLDHFRRRLPFIPGYVAGWSDTISGSIMGRRPSEIRPVDVIANINAPILLLHGDRDWLVPNGAADALAAAAGENAHLVKYPGRHDQPKNEAMQALVRGFVTSV